MLLLYDLRVFITTSSSFRSQLACFDRTAVDLSCYVSRRLRFQAGEKKSSSPGCSWMEVAGGDVELTEEGQAQGASEFGTARVVGVALRKKTWYFEVLFLASLALLLLGKGGGGVLVFFLP